MKPWDQQAAIVEISLIIGRLVNEYKEVFNLEYWLDFTDTREKWLAFCEERGFDEGKKVLTESEAK